MVKNKNTVVELVETTTEIEAPYELPEGWKWCSLEKLCSIPITDGTHQTPIYSDEENGIPFISSKDVTKKYIDWENIKYITKELHTELYKRVAPKIDDILLAKNGTTGVAAIVDNDKIFDIYVTLALLRPNKDLIVPNYLLNVVNSPVCKNQFDEHLTGIGVPNLHLRDIKLTQIPLPPTLEEQQRIVNRIETLFAKLDQAKEKAQNVVDTFETRKASILHKAFTGELTKKWRKERIDNGELKNDNWYEKTIGECCFSLKYGTSSKSESYGTIAVIRMGNLQKGEIIYDDLVYSNNEEDIRKYKLSKYDVLFNRTNSPEWVGKTSIYRGDIPAIYAGYLIKLDYDHEILNGCFLNFILNTPEAKDYCKSVKTDGVNQSNINAQKIGAFKIPVPSLLEQQEIVRVLDIVFEKEKQAKEAAIAVLEQIDLLKKSILARAFRGEI